MGAEWALWLYGFMALWLYGFMLTYRRYFIVSEPQKYLNQNQIVITEKARIAKEILVSELFGIYFL